MAQCSVRSAQWRGSVAASSHSPFLSCAVLWCGLVWLLCVPCVGGEQGIRIVPQQSAWIIERFGKFHTILEVCGFVAV